MDAIAKNILGRDDIGRPVPIEIARNDPMASVERVDADLSPRLNPGSGTTGRAKVAGIKTERRRFGRCESGCEKQTGEYFDRSLHGRRFDVEGRCWRGIATGARPHRMARLYCKANIPSPVAVAKWQFVGGLFSGGNKEGT